MQRNREALESKGTPTVSDRTGPIKNPSRISNGLTRRSFLKTSALAAGTVAVLGGAGCSSVGVVEESDEEKVITAGCRGNCQGCCLLNVTVRGGIVRNVAPFPQPEAKYTGFCLRGLSNIQRCYKDTRIKYPMRRIGERGSGEWERISWEEAIAEISDKFCHYRDTYGGLSIVKDAESGNQGSVTGPRGLVMTKLFGCIGTTNSTTVYDANCWGVSKVIGNSSLAGFFNDTDAIEDARMVVVWGTNPVYSQPHFWRLIRMAQDQGTKVVVFDPMKSATAHKADQYIPVKPGSDLINVLAMCNYLIEHDLVDIDFIKTHTNGPFMVRDDTGEMYFDSEEGEEREATDYYVYDSAQKMVCKVSEASDVELEGSYTINGVEVTTAFTLLKNHLKQYTMEDASEMSGVPLDVLVEFTETYATIGPVTLNVAYGLDHYYNGQQFFHAIAVLQAITGNFIRPGAGFSGSFRSPDVASTNAFAKPKNPVKNTSIPNHILFDVWRDQEYMGKPYPLKALLTTGSNSMGNYCDQNRWFSDVFPNLEFWVYLDTAWTDSALHADIVLPAAEWFEVSDFRSSRNSPYLTLGEQVIEPLHESKPDSEILAMIGNAMGYKEDFPLDYTTDDWIKLALDNDRSREFGVTWESMHKNHVMHNVKRTDVPLVIGNENSPLTTQSGRFEIYWEDPAPRLEFGQTITDEMAAKERLPYWEPPREAWQTSPQFEKYPLVFLQLHERYFTHTQYFDVPVLKELHPKPVIHVSRSDAESRGLVNGDIVEMFNDRGSAVLTLIIDDNMSPGVTYMPKGWQRNQFIDGGYQTLTDSYLDPWGIGGIHFDTLIEIRKWNG